MLADPATTRIYLFRDEAQDVFAGDATGGGVAGLLDGVPECPQLLGR